MFRERELICSIFIVAFTDVSNSKPIENLFVDRAEPASCRMAARTVSTTRVVLAQVGVVIMATTDGARLDFVTRLGYVTKKVAVITPNNSFSFWRYGAFVALNK